MKKTYQAGIVGFGGMGGFHYNCLKEYDRLNVTGIYDIDPARQEAASKMGLKAYESREALLSDQNIDIILCATPNDMHKEICIDAMNHKKHVICEKPVAMSSLQLQEMMDAAQQNSVVFTIDQNRRTNKDFLIVKHALENGTIGRIYSLESRVQGAHGVHGWRREKAKGGGMLLDWGVHMIDQLLYLLPQKVVNVFCKMYSIGSPEVDDIFSLFLEFQDGTTALVEVGTNNFIAHPRWYVCGVDGTLVVDDWNCNGKIIRSTGHSTEWSGTIVNTGAGPTRTMAPRDPASIEELPLEAPDVPDTLLRVWDGLLDKIEGVGPLWVEPTEAMRVMKVMEAAIQSNTEKQAVRTEI